MVAEAEEGERDAQKCAREWLDRAELATALSALGRQKSAQIGPRGSGGRHRRWQQLSRRPGAWLSRCWQLRPLWRMLQWRVLGMSAQRAAKLRPKGIFGRRLQEAGVVEAVEAVIRRSKRSWAWAIAAAAAATTTAAATTAATRVDQFGACSSRCK